MYSPDFAHVIPSTVLETELDVEEAEGAVLSDPILPHPVDNQIRWIHFVLGCAVLLPWNGMALVVEPISKLLTSLVMHARQ